MEFNLFAEIKPTWEIIGFGEETDLFPSAYYDIRIEQTDQPDKRVPLLTRYAVCGMVIGESLVFRKFRTVVAYDAGNGRLERSMKPVEEICRYVFGPYGVIIEKPDKSYAITSAERIPSDDVYDMMQDAERHDILRFYDEFVDRVKLKHKDEVIRAFRRMRCPRIEFELFRSVYADAEDQYRMEEDVPELIRHELTARKHRPNTAVRIRKDLIVVTGVTERKNSRGTLNARVYFDGRDVWYFVCNPVSGIWHKADLKQDLRDNRIMRNRIIPKDLLEHTCMEIYAEPASGLWPPRCNRVSLGVLMAVKDYLCAEQAAKTDIRIFKRIIENIYAGILTDQKSSLSQVLGITGAQIKFLKNIKIPGDLYKFAGCMRSEGFKTYFPDVEKRIFAAAFYLNQHHGWNSADDLTQKEIFACARTISSLARTDPDKREWMLDEYGDYIRMHFRYRTFLDRADENLPLMKEIRSFGDIPLNMKPSRIHENHAKLSRIMGIIRNSSLIADHSPAIRERKKKETRKWEYTNDVYSILMPEDAEDIIREGRLLQHCVGSAGYIGAMAREKCTILFLRKNGDTGKPLITIEERDGAIRQCYGFRDSINTDPAIRDFIEEYAAKHDLKIEARIYTEKHK